MSYEELRGSLAGIHAINVTPFGEDREIDYEGLRQNIDFLVDEGLGVIVPCGNTGEFYSLTLEEARAITGFVTETVGGRARVLAGIGYDLRTAADMAQHAQAAGADAVMIHQPIHPFLMTEGLIRYYSEIARSVDVGVVLYVRHASVDREVLEKVTSLENVLAVKYAVNDLPQFGRLVHSIDNPVTWVCGSAELWAPFFFAVGAEGFTSGLVNVAPEKSLAMLEGLEEGDQRLVQSIWKEIAPFEELRAKHSNGNNVTVVKEAMNLVGLRAGRVREPISELSEDDRRELIHALQGMGKELREEARS